MINIHLLCFALIHLHICHSRQKALLSLFAWPRSAFIWHGGPSSEPLKMTFYCCTARLHLSSSHLCAATMTVQVACGAWMPWWHLSAPPRDNNSESVKRAGVLTGRLPPGASHSTPEASPPTHTHPLHFVHQGQGTKCWVIHTKLSGWKRLQMLLFFVSFGLFSLCLFSLHLVSISCQGTWCVSF